MMLPLNHARPVPVFTCAACGKTLAARPNQCPRCKHWATYARPEELRAPKPVRMSKVKTERIQRRKTGIPSLDEALGGGLAFGGTYLLSGEPGSGKSTLTQQIAAQFDEPLFVLGEEREDAFKVRFKRLGLLDPGIVLIRTTDVDVALDADAGCDLLVVDSLSVLTHPEVKAPAGTNEQLIAVTQEIVSYAQEARDMVVLFIGHVNQDGRASGARRVEHLVDGTVLVSVDPETGYRRVDVTKHRFGPTPQTAVLEMTRGGLIDAPDEEEDDQDADADADADADTDARAKSKARASKEKGRARRSA